MSTIKNKLRILKIEYICRAEKKVEILQFPGNAIRGALGRTIYDNSCNKPKPQCENCEKNKECLYSILFKSVAQNKYLSDVPNPFVVEFEKSKCTLSLGDSFSFFITLFGEAVTYYKEITKYVEIMVGKYFLGVDAPFSLIKARDALGNCLFYDTGKYVLEPNATVWTDANNPFMPVDHVTLEFITPFEYHGVDYKNIRFGEFMDRLITRIAEIHDVYESEEFVLPYLFAFKNVQAVSTLDLKVVKVRQEKRSFSGAIGKITFDGSIGAYMPYILLGKELHFGRLTTRGFGRYKVIL